MEKKSTVFRNLLQSGNVLDAIAVGTAHHAQLAERTGFKAAVISGAMTSAHLLGLPDTGFLTLTELAQNAERICRAVVLLGREEARDVVESGEDLRVRCEFCATAYLLSPDEVGALFPDG